jgi:hypothetical protein
MVNKNLTTARKRGKVNVGKLKLTKETVRNLSKEEAKGVRGGRVNLSLSRAVDGCGTDSCVLAK